MITKDSRYSIFNIYPFTDQNGGIHNIINGREILSFKIGSTYRVQEGDTLENISHKLLGDANLWWTIADSNDIFDPDVLVAGTLLDIPDAVSVGGVNGF